MYLGDGGARGPFEGGGGGGSSAAGATAAAVLPHLRRDAATQQREEAGQADRLTETAEDGRGLGIANFVARVAAAQDVGQKGGEHCLGQEVTVAALVDGREPQKQVVDDGEGLEEEGGVGRRRLEQEGPDEVEERGRAAGEWRPCARSAYGEGQGVLRRVPSRFDCINVCLIYLTLWKRPRASSRESVGWEASRTRSISCQSVEE